MSGVRRRYIHTAHAAVIASLQLPWTLLQLYKHQTDAPAAILQTSWPRPANSIEVLRLATCRRARSEAWIAPLSVVHASAEVAHAGID